MTRRSVRDYLAAQRERLRAGPACGPQPVAGRDGHRHGLSPEGHHSSSCDRLPPARDVAAASAGPGSTTARWRARHRSSGRPRGPIGAKRRQPFVPELLERLLAPARRTGSRRALRASRSLLQGPLAGMGLARVADWPARSKWIGRTAVAVAIALSILKAAGTDASLLFDARYEAKSYLRRNVPKDAIVEVYSTPTYLPRFREMGFPVRLIAEQSSGDDAMSGPALVARAPDVIVLSSKHLEGTAPEYAAYFKRPACRELRPPGHRVPGESALAENWRGRQSGICLSRQPHDLDPRADAALPAWQRRARPWPATQGPPPGATA